MNLAQKMEIETTDCYHTEKKKVPRCYLSYLKALAWDLKCLYIQKNKSAHIPPAEKYFIKKKKLKNKNQEVTLSLNRDFKN